MQTQHYLISIFLILFSVINCVDRRETFAENIRSYAKSVTKPTKTDELISDFKNKLILLFYTLTIDEINKIQVKFDLSDSLTLQIKAAPYARVSGAIKVEEEKPSGFFSFEKTLGSAVKEDDGRITFALIKTKSFANLILKYDTYTEKICKKKFIFKKCYKVKKQRERELTNSEQLIVRNAVEYSATNSILESVDILKNGDYELYMTDTGSIFSPDHKSVAHLTYFGNIAIGPISELNSILPIDYKYEFESGLNNGHLVKKATGDIIELNNYPNLNNGNYLNLVIKKGYFHKFNFIIKNKIKKFPSEYSNYMITASENGPYILEVKKNGNVILYQKNNKNNILWQTNTSNQGIGPYNFHLTNDKLLILEDSNGKILYQSEKYINLPTIFYGNSGSNGVHVYNGQNINGFVGQHLNQLHLESKECNIIYGGKIKIINRDISRSSSSDNNNIPYPDTYIYENFHASISNNNEYDICYTAQLRDYVWTSVGCNGEKVGYEITEKTRQNSDVSYNYIESLIIYVKEKEESVAITNRNVPKITTI